VKAIFQEAYGSADVLQFKTVEKPTVKDDEVLVRVSAAGVDRGVWHLMTGKPYVARLVFGIFAPKNPIPGMDVAGRVEAVGKKVTRFREGDEVFGTCEGSFAEYACAKEDKLCPKPARLSFEQAAAVPISACTALTAVRDIAKIELGHRVLIVGASGGVGTYCVQLAKAFGGLVTGVCSRSKQDLVLAMGADCVIDYSRHDMSQFSNSYDVILDIGGNRSLATLRRLLASDGTLVIIGGEGGESWFGMGRQLQALLLSPFTRQKLRSCISLASREELQGVSELIDAGKLKPAIDKMYPLEEAPEAIRYLERGEARGKVVIAVAGGLVA
jgi:NADPH:quinone reductase-like Zn-dependent oxidoreductase